MSAPTKRPPSSAPQRRRRGIDPQPTPGAPRVRRGTVRLAGDVAWRVRIGHPWIFREALGNRPLREGPGETVDVLDETGDFVGRGLYDPNGPIAIRVFTHRPDESLDAAGIRQRVLQARELRQRLLPPGLTVHRIIHGEGDGIPGVVVDRYGDFLVVQLYTAAVEPLRESLYAALEEIWRPHGIYEQHRYRPQTGEGPRAPAELVRGAVAPVEVEVREGEVRFAVDVTAPLGSGLFPDLRVGRQAIGRLAAGRSVLNLFSYTGAFSLYAARGGAREVVSVDLASKAHARARHNLTLNGMPEQGQEFIAGDVLKVLARMAERSRRFDLVIIDPPSFAQGKGQVFVAQRDYRDLVAATLSVLAPHGLLACASNTAKIPLEEFDRIIGDGAQRGGRRLGVIERFGLPPDFPVPAGFPEGHYLKFSICAAMP
ncbi:MAG TPA: class I SAM-dependent rRNA methyltransferase [Polyangia bacterium]|nr:class I SAM-dependent rRNA methyltransferase [Polyangia bacterium]